MKKNKITTLLAAILLSSQLCFGTGGNDKLSTETNLKITGGIVATNLAAGAGRDILEAVTLAIQGWTAAETEESSEEETEVTESKEESSEDEVPGIILADWNLQRVDTGIRTGVRAQVQQALDALIQLLDSDRVNPGEVIDLIEGLMADHHPSVHFITLRIYQAIFDNKSISPNEKERLHQCFETLLTIIANGRY